MAILRVDARERAALAKRPIVADVRGLERALQSVHEIKASSVGRDSRAIGNGDVINACGPQTSIRKAIKGATLRRLIVVHRSKPEAPGGIDDAVIEAIARLIGLDFDDEGEGAALLIEMMEPRLQTHGEAARSRGKNKAALLRSLPAALPAACGMIAVDLSFLDID